MSPCNQHSSVFETEADERQVEEQNTHQASFALFSLLSLMSTSQARHENYQKHMKTKEKVQTRYKKLSKTTVLT